MSFWSTLGNALKGGVTGFLTGGPAGAAVGAIGGGLSGAANSMAHNRGTQVDVEFEKMNQQRAQEQAFFNTLLAREQERRAAGNDAWKRLQQASYISNWAPHAGVSPYTRPLTAPAGDIVGMARTPELWAELSKRAAYQDPFNGAMPTQNVDTSKVDKNSKASVWETLLGIGGAAANAYGAFPRQKNGTITDDRS